MLSGTNSFNSAVSSRANYSGDEFQVQFEDDPVTGVPFLFSAEERAKFSLPAAGEYGNTGRNAFRFPWSFNLDAALIKHVRIRERISFEFRAEAFNLTNTPYFSFPTVTVTTPATVGRSLAPEPLRASCSWGQRSISKRFDEIRPPHTARRRDLTQSHAAGLSFFRTANLEFWTDSPKKASDKHPPAQSRSA